MEMLVNLLVMALFGLVCAVIAGQRGRSAVGWFFIGCILGCVGMVLVLVLPDLKKQHAREAALQRENRRLRERVKKDRIVADQRHGEVARRLGVHDAAVGVDTSAPTGNGVLPPPLPTRDNSQEWSNTQWHVELQGDSFGPISHAQLREYWQSGEVRKSTFVWNESLTDWTEVQRIPGLRESFDA